MEMALSLRNSRNFGLDLVMPQNSVDLDNDEMEYVDGGTFYNYAWGSVDTSGVPGPIIVLNQKSCGLLSAAAATGGVTAGFVGLLLGIPTVGTGALVCGAIALACGSFAALLSAASYLNGFMMFTINYHPYSGTVLI